MVSIKQLDEEEYVMVRLEHNSSVGINAVINTLYLVNMVFRGMVHNNPIFWPMLLAPIGAPGKMNWDDQHAICAHIQQMVE